MNPGTLLALLTLAACAATPPVVTTAGTIANPAYTVAGDTPAAAEVRRQLTASGRYSPAAPAIIRVGFAATPRAIGTCAAPDSAPAKACPEWLDAPQSGFAPFAPKQRYRLTLVVETGALDAGSVTVVQPAKGKTAPLPAMVTAALAALVPSPAATN